MKVFERFTTMPGKQNMGSIKLCPTGLQGEIFEKAWANVVLGKSDIVPTRAPPTGSMYPPACSLSLFDRLKRSTVLRSEESIIDLTEKWEERSAITLHRRKYGGPGSLVILLLLAMC